jgi:tetratricopeptide (TPR) repeat protein
MADFAQKLMTAAQVWSSVEFPSRNPIPTRSPQKSTIRIGLWPIISNSEPELSMGIGMVLAAVLEQWSSTCVYRLAVQVSGTPSQYQWAIEDSQFGVDDWEIEGLDENVAIWGDFEVHRDLFRLSIEVEDDAREDDSILELNHETKTVAEMLNQLPIIAAKIMSWLTASPSDQKNTYENINSVDPQLIKDFLRAIFHWELDYFLELWGQGTNADNVLNSQNNLIEFCNRIDGNFGAWMTSQSISRFVLFDQTYWSEWLLPTLKETAVSLDRYPIVAVILGITMFRLNENLKAFDILETSLSIHPEDSETWVALGDIYWKSSEDLSAIDVYQRGIEANAATSEVYLRYAVLMDSLVEHQIELKEGTSRVSAAGRPFVERYVLTSSTTGALSLHESCAAYRHAIELDASNIDALACLVIGLLSLDDPGAWSFCVQVVDKDKEGTVIASIIEQLPASDMIHMIDILQSASAKNPQALSLHLNLARAYSAIGQNEKANHELSAISIKDIPSQVQSSVARLRLSTDDPDFDSRLGEIQDILNTKSRVTTEDVEFLEAVIEKEPLFSEGYRLLAQSYLSWSESDDALEVLLDGQKTAPFDTELIALLAKVLWNANEPDLAFAYLDQGLDHDSQNATLLSLMGRFLFDNGEDEDAKDYLRQAETVDPLNSELSATRFYIANTLIKNKKANNS